MPEFLSAGLTLPRGTSDPATEGELRYRTDTDGVRVGDGVRARRVGPLNFSPYAEPFGYVATAGVTVRALAVGETLIFPMLVPGDMLVQQWSVWTTDTATARGPLTFRIFSDRLNNANTLSEIAGVDATLASYTPTVAVARTQAVTTPGTYVPAGLYWAAMRNGNATQTAGIGSVSAAVSFGMRSATKVTALGTTLDIIAATWTKLTWVPLIRLEGRYAGSTVVF